jgi:hypothetical protein
VKITALRRAETAGVDEPRAGRGEQNLARCFAQEIEEQGGAREVELTRNIVQQEHGMNVACSRDAGELGQFEAQGDSAMLALRRVNANVITAEPKNEIVAMGTRRGAAAVAIAFALGR